MTDMTRREFLGASAAGIALASAGVLLPQRVLGANDRLRVGLIGTGDRMGSLMSSFHGQSDKMNCELTGVCDIYKPNREKAVSKVKDWYGATPKVYQNYEEMLADKNIDGVIIATCDFMHATMLKKAILAGKHTYCEKPTANTLEDANAVLAAAEAHPNVIVQVGTQRRSDTNHYAANDFIKTGALGQITRVSVRWNDLGPRWLRKDTGAKPEDVDWKQFCFGRVDRPFDARVFREWRLFRPFSFGIPDQWMSHLTDAVHIVTGAKLPRSCVAMGGIYNWKDGRESVDMIHALYDYPEGFILNYATGFGNDGGKELRVMGTNGTVLSGEFDPAGWHANGEGGGKEKLAQDTPLKGEPMSSHMANWLESVRAGKQPRATVQFGYQHSIALIMAVMAMDSGRKQIYDPEKRTITSA